MENEGSLRRDFKNGIKGLKVCSGEGWSFSLEELAQDQCI